MDAAMFRTALRLSILSVAFTAYIHPANAGLLDRFASPTFASSKGVISSTSAAEAKTPGTTALPVYSSAENMKPVEVKKTDVKESETPSVPDAVKAAGDAHGSAAVKPPASGTALVRIIDGTTSGVDVKINGKSYSAAAGSIGKYYSMPLGTVEAVNGSERTSFNLSSGGMYSILVGQGKFESRQEPALDPNKAQFVLINLSGAPGVSIKTSAGAASDVGPAQPGAVATSQINPINVTLGVYDGNSTLLATLTGLTLEKGAAYTVLVYPGSGGKTVVTYAKAVGG